MEFFGVPLYDDDLLKLLFRLAINLVVVTAIVRFVYYRQTHRKEYLFTFFMLNVLVFFVCFTLKKFELGLGMALGLFAIFGILRYRTTTIPTKEMTYLFTVIGVGVINALANKKMSYAELAFTNAFIIGLAAVLENMLLFKREHRETLVYEHIDLVHPSRHGELVADLEQRTGLKISRVELSKLNFLNDTAQIEIYYYPHLQHSSSEGEVEVTYLTQEYN